MNCQTKWKDNDGIIQKCSNEGELQPEGNFKCKLHQRTHIRESYITKNMLPKLIGKCVHLIDFKGSLHLNWKVLSFENDKVKIQKQSLSGMGQIKIINLSQLRLTGNPKHTKLGTQSLKDSNE